MKLDARLCDPIAPRTPPRPGSVICESEPRGEAPRELKELRRRGREEGPGRGSRRQSRDCLASGGVGRAQRNQPQRHRRRRLSAARRELPVCAEDVAPAAEAGEGRGGSPQP
ncbi:Protein Topaz1 [Manis pentadactyla]|nr:Protein Topaz1 [Manis pentadactyla]